MPILVNLIGGRKALAQGHYDFKMFGVFCNVVSIGKCIAAVVVLLISGV